MKAIHSHFSYRLIYKFSLPQHKIPSIGCPVFVLSFRFFLSIIPFLSCVSLILSSKLVLLLQYVLKLFCLRFKIKSGRREISHVSIETRFSTNQRSLTINVIL